MPYSKAWRSAMYPDFKEQGAYVDYKATKAILHRMKENLANPATPDELYNSLVMQKKVVYEWCKKKVAEVEMVAEALYAASEHILEDDSSYVALALVTDENPHSRRPMRPKDAKQIADSITHELLRYVECKNLNTDTIEHILGRMYRYAVLGPTGQRWKNIYTVYDYNELSVDKIFYFLSCTYDRVKKCEERISTQAMNNGAVGSQEFDRRSVKYWVHLQDLPFVIARIIPHLPLSTFTDTYGESKRRGVPFTLFSPVSSVYWDNPQFLFYHRRLERVEGSTLIRMRWYSDTFAEDWNALKDTDRVFMEIKVHHEAWSGERSNKRRFALKANEVDHFVAANLSLHSAVEKLQRDGASKKQQENFQSLATEILSKIHAYSLKPAMRTQCGRAAFQRGADQSVRVSIDTDLRFYAEDFGLGHHWRYEGNDAPSSTFPYAVVEVKLQCAENERIAPWIEELMSCRHMESIPKFSKYAHGIATLYGHTSFIHMVPYWMHQLDIDIRASTKPELAHWDPTAGLASGCMERAADRFIFGTGAAQTQSVGAAEAKFLPRSNYTRVYQQVLRQLNAQAKENQDLAMEPSNNSISAAEGAAEEAPVVQYSVNHRHQAYTNFHLYPYTVSGVESLCFTTPGSKNGVAHAAFDYIPWQTGKRIRVPQKYDPKTLLTAERYMAEWSHFASQIGLLGIGIIHFGRSMQLPSTLVSWAPLWTARFHIFLGLLLVGVSLVTLAYSYVAFRARCRRVYARRKIRFDHPAGPTWLTCAIMFSLLVLGCSHIANRYGPMITHSDDF
eukprot:gene635-352_t